jgi:hypothetical protein
MIRVSVKGDFAPIVAMLDRLARPDLAPLARELRRVMIDDNREGLLAGTNADGGTADELRPATIRRGRGGEGPPRVPRGAGSRMVADYEVEVQQAPDRVLLIGGWRNTPFVRFHSTGTRGMVARDPVGIRPSGQARIGDELSKFAAKLMGSF